MRIVVTGALGHIGSRLIREIPQSLPEAEVVMIDNLATQRYASLFDLPGDHYFFFEKDILDADLDALMTGADCAVHLAALTDATTSFQNKDKVEAINLRGTERVAKACEKANCALLFVSTTSVYGTQKKKVDEDCPASELKPQSPYAEAKLKAESFIQKANAAGSLQSVIFRCGTICGVSPGMRFHTAVNKFCWQAVMGQPLTVWKTALRQERPYLDLQDAVQAILFVIKQKQFDQKIYNIVTENLTVEAILGMIRRALPKVNVEYVETEIMNQLSYQVSAARFEKLGFAFSGNIEKRVQETIGLLKGAQSRHGG